MRYLLNSAVVTSFGTYIYSEIPFSEAKEWITEHRWESTIGYAETAEAMSQLFGVPVPVDRKTIKMLVGDEALVFRLVFPPGSPRIDPKNKGTLGTHLLAGNYELGLLRRIK